SQHQIRVVERQKRQHTNSQYNNSGQRKTGSVTHHCSALRRQRRLLRELVPPCPCFASIKPNKQRGCRQRPKEEEAGLVSKRNQPIDQTAQDQSQKTSECYIFQRA